MNDLANISTDFRAGLLTLLVPQAQVQPPRPGEADTVAFEKIWNIKQERLLGAFVGFNVVAMILIFFLVPETAGASVGKEHGKLNYMSLEELNYIFGVPTPRHIQYQIRHVLPWAAAMVKYRVYSILGREAQKPFLEKMYYWVAVKAEDSSESEKDLPPEQVEGAATFEQESRETSTGEIRYLRLPRLSFEPGDPPKTP